MPTTATSLQRVSGIAELRNAIAGARQNAARIGFVPTMGALHSGHLSLVERARAECDLVVMSIFVNPLQFGPTEDFTRYPRPIEEDERLATQSGVDILFTPGADDMYPDGRMITVTAGEHGKKWEGAVRPGHFDGVLTVVAKLFNVVQPDISVFGRKDLQQAALVKSLVRDLDFPMTIIVVEERRGSMFGQSMDNHAYIPITTYQRMFGRRQSIAIHGKAATREQFEAAIEQAKKFVEGCDVELWEGPRFVIGLRSSDKSGVATPDPPSNPTCPTCNVPMWLMKVQLGDVAEAQEFECKVCDGKVRRTLPRAG